MKRCNYCFRYALRQPSYCPHCGRSYEVRICPRGHVSPRAVRFCATCGSDDLSTPAPPEGLLARASRWALVGWLYLFVAILAVSVALSLLATVDWNPLIGLFGSMLIMAAVLYWATTLLPGPVKKVGRAAGRQAARAMRKGRERRG